MAKVEESNRGLQDFAFVASHDLKEPLRKVKTFGRILRDRYADTLGDEGRNYVERMMNASDRMEGLINSLLDYSRVSTLSEPFSQVDLNLVVRGVLEDLEGRISQTKANVIVEQLPIIEADPAQMRQLFQNLIGNSLKFNGGKQPIIKVYATLCANGTCEIRVEDNGIGFEEEYLEKIFKPFQRLHGRSAYEGTGMGLAICKKIVDRHKGDITAISKPGKGATFIIKLPETQPIHNK